jgi:hypothetical protein
MVVVVELKNLFHLLCHFDLCHSHGLTSSAISRSVAQKLSTLLALNRDPSIDPSTSLCNETHRLVSWLVSLSLSL